MDGLMFDTERLGYEGWLHAVTRLWNAKAENLKQVLSLLAKKHFAPLTSPRLLRCSERIIDYLRGLGYLQWGCCAFSWEPLEEKFTNP